MNKVRDLMEEHRHQVMTLPSDLPTLLRVRELVRQAVAYSERWDAHASGKVLYLREIVAARLVQIGALKLCYVGVNVTRNTTPELPPQWGGNAQELVQAIKELREPKLPHQGLHTDGERLRAVAILFEILADLEDA